MLKMSNKSYDKKVNNNIKRRRRKRRRFVAELEQHQKQQQKERSLGKSYFVKSIHLV